MITLKNITKSYGSLQVVQNLSLTIPEGQITVLIGPSGCGKTTILEMINGLVKPDFGEILVGEEDVAHTNIIRLRRRIGYVIQEVGLFPHYTVYDNIALVPRLLHWDEKHIQARVHNLLELMNIPEDRLDKFPHQLSGGQQQRVGVARALAADPAYLLMDEPFGALDPINRSRLQEEFLDLQERLHKTVVFVTHDMDEALKVGNWIAILNEGELLQFDTPLKVLQQPANHFVRQFLGTDRYTKALRALRVRDVVERTLQQWSVLPEDTPCQQALADMQGKELEFAFLIDSKGKYAGCVHKENIHPGSLFLIEAVMDVEVLYLKEDLEIALGKILSGSLPALPVVDERYALVSVLTLNRLREQIQAIANPQEKDYKDNGTHET